MTWFSLFSFHPDSHLNSIKSNNKKKEFSLQPTILSSFLVFFSFISAAHTCSRIEEKMLPLSVWIETTWELVVLCWGFVNNRNDISHWISDQVKCCVWCDDVIRINFTRIFNKEYKNFWEFFSSPHNVFKVN